MITPIVLHTVPHTGTHFVESAFEAVGLERGKDFCRAHAPRVHKKALYPSHANQLYTALTAKKLVVTARDPYLSAIRWVTTAPNKTVLQMSFAWDHFFDTLSRREYFIVDIGCREQDRFDHLCNLVSYLDVDYRIDDVKKFAEAWKPEYSSNTGAKQRYLKTGELPNSNLGKWSLLDDTVAWYKRLPTNDFEDK
jgi:hypothetical protein